MVQNYICYIRNGHLQVEDAGAAGGARSDATLYSSDSGYPQRVHFHHLGRRPRNQQNKEALALAAHKAWIAKCPDTPYCQNGVDVLHGRMRNVPYVQVVVLATPSDELEFAESELKI